MCSQHKSLKVEAISCQQKYLILIFFVCLQVGESTSASKDGSGAGEDVWALAQPKVARFEIVRYRGFNFQQQHISTFIHSFLLYTPTNSKREAAQTKCCFKRMNYCIATIQIKALTFVKFVLKQQALWAECSA
jgi:hypothetical protein